MLRTDFAKLLTIVLVVLTCIIIWGISVDASNLPLTISSLLLVLFGAFATFFNDRLMDANLKLKQQMYNYGSNGFEEDDEEVDVKLPFLPNRY